MKDAEKHTAENTFMKWLRKKVPEGNVSQIILNLHMLQVYLYKKRLISTPLLEIVDMDILNHVLRHMNCDRGFRTAFYKKKGDTLKYCFGLYYSFADELSQITQTHEDNIADTASEEHETVIKAVAKTTHLSNLQMNSLIDNDIISETMPLHKCFGFTKLSYDVSIANLDLSERAYNCMNRASIRTVNELLDTTKEQLNHIQGFGIGTFNDIIKCLNDYLCLSRSTGSTLRTRMQLKEYYGDQDLLKVGFFEQELERLRSNGISSIDMLLDCSENQLLALPQMNASVVTGVIAKLRDYLSCFKQPEKITLRKRFNVPVDLESEKISVIGYSNRAVNIFGRLGMQSFGEILNFTEEDLTNIDRMGASTVVGIVDVTRKYVENHNNDRSDAMHSFVNHFNKVQMAVNGNLKLKPFLDSFAGLGEKYKNFAKYIEDCLRDKPLVKDIFAYCENVALDVSGEHKAFRDFIQWLDFDLLELVDMRLALKAQWKDKEKLILNERIGGKTLEEVGKATGLTRERVRQIERKTYAKLADIINCDNYDLIALVHALRDEDKVLQKTEVSELLGQELTSLYWSYYAKTEKRSDHYYFDKKINSFVFDDGIVKKDTGNVDVLQDMPPIFHEDEYQKLLDDAVRIYGVTKEYIELRLNDVYKHDGIFWHRTKLTRNFCYNYVLEHDFPNGFRILTKENTIKVRKCYERYFNMTLDDVSDNTIDTKIGEVGVLCDRGKYIHKSKINLAPYVITEINDYIKSSSRNVITFMELYDAMKDVLKGTAITNRFALQGALSLYGCDYNIGRDFVTKNEKLTIADELEGFIRKHGKVTKDDLRAAFSGLTDANFALMLQRCPEVICLNDGEYMHSDCLQITEEERNEILLFLQGFLTSDPVRDKLVLRKFRVDYSGFLKKNNIHFAAELFGVLAYLYDDEFFFHRPYIATADFERGATGRKLSADKIDATNRSIEEELDDILVNNDNTGEIEPLVLAATIAISDSGNILSERFNELLADVFGAGLKVSGSLAKSKFRRAYAEKYGSDLELDDSELETKLTEYCVIREGKAFPSTNDDKKKAMAGIVACINDTFMHGATCIFWDMLYERFKEMMANKFAVYSLAGFKQTFNEYVQQGYCYTANYLYQQHVVPNVGSEVTSLLSSKAVPMSVDAVHNLLWYFTIEEIKIAMNELDNIIYVGDFKYLYINAYPLSQSDVLHIAELIRKEHLQKDYITVTDLCALVVHKLPVLWHDVGQYPDIAFRDAIKYYLASEFEFNGNLISKKGMDITASDIIRDAIRNMDSISFEEYAELCRDHDSSINMFLLCEEMVRTEVDVFVNKKNIEFDVVAVDEVISGMCPGDYVPLSEISLFMQFPPIGVKWNSFVLESYVFAHSKKFKLIIRNFKYKDICGTIVRKNSPINNLHDLVVDYLSYRDDWQEGASALELLTEVKILPRKVYSKIEEAMKQARLNKEKREKEADV